MRNYETLDPAKIIDTVEKLKCRIGERFAANGLHSICSELELIARQANERALWLARPIWAVRMLVLILVAAAAWGLSLLAPRFTVPEGEMNIVVFLQAFESAVNDILLCGAGLFFLLTWEVRIKRDRALKALHELRSLAHIIDMHQLTKDPERVSGRAELTSSSPRVPLTPFQLGRYLDYCAEMLSLVGKIAALYAAHLNDPVVLAGVNEIEELSNGFARKVWQKIMILENMRSSA